MLFFSTDVKDNHPMSAIGEAKPGARMPEPEQVGMEHVSFEVASFAELQEVYRKFKEHKVKLTPDDLPRCGQKHLLLRSRRQPAELYLQRATVAP